MVELLTALLLQDPASRTAALLFWVALALGLAFILTRRSRTQRLRGRVRELTADEEEAQEASTRPPLVIRLAQYLLARRAKMQNRDAPADDTLALKMWRAGFYGAAAPAWWIIWRIVLVPVGAVLGILVMLGYAADTLPLRQGVALGAGGGALLGLVAPLIYRRNRTEKRMAALRSAWPDLLDLLALTIGAGLTLETALLRIRDLLGHKVIDLARELTVLTAELTYFGDRVRALQNLSRRCPLAEAEELVTALIQADRKGLPLGNLLNATAREQRRKRRLEIEKKAASLPAKLTVPMILFFLPALLIVILAPVAFRLGTLF